MGTGEGSEPLSSKPESGSDFLSTYNYDPLSRPAFRLSLASDFNFCLPLFGHVLPLIEKITPELYHTIQSSPVCTENLNPDVMVMQSAEYRVRLDIPDSLNGTKGRRIFVQ